MTTDPRPEEIRTAEGTAIQITDVSKTFGRGDTALVALDRISLSVAPGEFVCLIGASGCGKSTLLSLVAGLDAPTSGELSTGGRRVSLMFQESALFPWLTAAKNVEMPMRASGVPRAERRERVAELLDLVQLSSFGDKRPHELSGGMRQRVALARALAQDADVLLMDEPFAAVDAQVREVLQEDLLKLRDRLRQTVVFITHSIDEAITLGDRIIVMGTRPGRIVRDVIVPIEQPRTIAEVRRHPAYAGLREEIWQQLRQSAAEQAGEPVDQAGEA